MTATMTDIDAKFAEALERDAGTTETATAEVAAPPRKPSVVDPEAPHGRAGDGTPHAPYGIGQNGKPRIKPAGPGRKPKDPDAKPRTAQGPQPATAAPASSGKDYSGDLDDLADGFWMLLSGIPAPGGLKTRLGAQAAILQANKANLVRSASIAAQHHEGTAQLIEKLTSGNAAWVLPAMFAAAPFVAQSVSMWRSPAEQVQALADQNAENFRVVVQAAALQAEFDAEGNGVQVTAVTR